MRQPLPSPFVGATVPGRPPPSPEHHTPARANKRPKRKPNRLKNYDYSQNGAYFVTLCINDRREILGRIVGEPAIDHPQFVGATVLGRPCTATTAARIELSAIGKIVDNAIKHYNQNLGDVVFDKYVIMPNHIHAIIVLRSETGDRGRSPLQNIVRNLKSYVTKNVGFSPWQKSFHDHIIRNEADYDRIAEYIENNPANWETDCFYAGAAAIDSPQPVGATVAVGVTHRVHVAIDHPQSVGATVSGRPHSFGRNETGRPRTVAPTKE